MAKRRKSKQLTFSTEGFDPLLAEAMREAREIREWTHGPNVPGWIVYRLAQALMGQGNERQHAPRSQFSPARSGVRGDQANLWSDRELFALDQRGGVPGR